MRWLKQLNDRVVTRLRAYPMVEGNHDAPRRNGEFPELNLKIRALQDLDLQRKCNRGFLNRCTALKAATSGRTLL